MYKYIYTNSRFRLGKAQAFLEAGLLQGQAVSCEAFIIYLSFAIDRFNDVVKMRNLRKMTGGKDDGTCFVDDIVLPTTPDEIS